MRRVAAYKSTGGSPPGKKISRQAQGVKLPPPPPSTLALVHEEEDEEGEDDDQLLQTQLPVEFEAQPPLPTATLEKKSTGTATTSAVKRSTRRHSLLRDDVADEDHSAQAAKLTSIEEPPSTPKETIKSRKKAPPESSTSTRQTRSRSTPLSLKKAPPAATETTPRMAALSAAVARLEEAEPRLDDTVVMTGSQKDGLNEVMAEEEDDDCDDSNRKPPARPTPKPSPSTAKMPSRSPQPSATHGATTTERDSAGAPQPAEAVMFMDHCKTLAQQHLTELYFDMIENEQELILTDQSSRQVHWFALKLLLDQFEHAEKEYGRVYCRTKLCGLLVDVSTATDATAPNLMHYDLEEWEELLGDLEATRYACLRSDCTAHVPHDPPDPVKREDRATLGAFSKNYNLVTNSCLINARLAPIRAKLHKQLQSGRSGPPELNPRKVQMLLTEARGCGSETVQHWIYMLFTPHTHTTVDFKAKKATTVNSLAVPTPRLKNLEDLALILAEKPFNLEWLENKLVSLIDGWDKICFGSYVPKLVQVKYQSRAHTQFHNRQRPKSGNRLPLQTTSQSMRHRHMSPPQSREGRRHFDEEIENLKRSRKALREDHGDDPLENSRELAEQATGVVRAASKKPRVESTPERCEENHEDEKMESMNDNKKKPKAPTFYESKRAKSQIAFDDTEDEMSPPNRVRLGEVPNRLDVTGTTGGSPMKTYIGPSPDDGVFDECGNVVKRNQWQSEEIDALVAGLEKHGVGKWVQIKNQYGYILRNRNSVQLKDKFRNMKRNGELPVQYL